MNINDGLKIVGRPIIRTYDKKYEPLIQELFSLGLTAERIAGMIPEKEIVIGRNMVITTGRQLIFRLLNGDTTTGLKYLVIGTNTVAPAMDDNWADVIESFRKLITSYAYDNSTLYCDTFIAAAEANFTWEEVVICGDSTATATAETGVIFSRALMHEVKANTETKTVSWQYTLS